MPPSLGPGILHGVDPTGAAVMRIRRFAQAMDPDVRPEDEALRALRALLDDAGVAYKIAGGIAVVHHGYVRSTDDLDVLVEAGGVERLDPHLAAHGFSRPSERRLVHGPTSVQVDLLVEGEALPRPGAGSYPSPGATEASPGDSAIVSLPALVTLKLRARRHQDTADVVALLKPLEDAEYLALESRVPAELRGDLLALRRDAIEERSWER